MPENVEPQRRSSRVRRVLWTLVAVTVTAAMAACSYAAFGRTSVDRDRGYARPEADASDGTDDLDSRWKDWQTRKVDDDGPDVSGARAAAAVRDDPLTGGDVVVSSDKFDQVGDDDAASYGFRPTTADDGSVGVVHQNVYSTIDTAAGLFPGHSPIRESATAEERHRFDHYNYLHYGGGGGDHYLGRRPLPPPRDEVVERPAARKTDWKTVAVLAAVALAKLTAVTLLQFAFVLGFKLLLAAVAASVKWLLLMKLGRVFYALAVVSPLLLLLLPPLIAALARAPLLQSGGGSFLQPGSSIQTFPAVSNGSGSSVQTLPAVMSGGSTFHMLPGRTSRAFRRASRD